MNEQAKYAADREAEVRRDYERTLTQQQALDAGLVDRVETQEETLRRLAEEGWEPL